MTDFDYDDKANDREDLTRLEERLREEFDRIKPLMEDIPDSIDRAVLSHIHRRAESIRRRRLLFIPRKAWIAGAAAVLLCACAWLLDFSALTGAGRAGPMDIDGSGQVDIVDAYVMSRKIDSNNGSWDFNGDGKVDGGDVGKVAAVAVNLDGKGQL